MNTKIGLAVASLCAAMIASASPAAMPVPCQIDVVPDNSRATPLTSTDLEPSPDPSVVDLGIFYGRELAERGLSLAALEATTGRMIDHTNAALAASGIPLTVRVAWAGEFPERLEGIDMLTALNMLAAHGQNVRTTLLADFGVDATILIKATDDADQWFGLSGPGNESYLSDPLFVPHSVVCFGMAQTSGLECFGSGGIFAHEFGHMLGAGHQPEGQVPGAGGAYVFSSASDCGGGTMMFSPFGTGPRVYSTPNVMAGNQPCGVSWTEGLDGIDNARTIDLLRALMADLRQSMPIDGAVMIEGQTEYAVAEGSPPLLLSVRRTGDLDSPARATVTVMSAPGHKSDISINPQELLFAPGEDVVDVQIAIIDDSVVESTETVEIDLRNPWRLENTGVPIKIAISDNDQQAPPPQAPPPQGSSGSGSFGLGSLLLLVLLASRRFCSCGLPVARP